MRKNNFFNFNPRIVEKHLSPFGQQVLNTLIKQWKTDHERNKNIISMLPQPRYSHAARNRVITFGESHSSAVNYKPDNILNDSINFNQEVNEEPFDFPPNIHWHGRSPNSEPGLLLLPAPLPSREGSRFPIPLNPVVPTSEELVTPGPVTIDTSHHDSAVRHLTNDLHSKDKHSVPNVSREDLITSFDIDNNAIRSRQNILKDIYGCSDDEDTGVSMNDGADINENICSSDISCNVDWEDMFDSELFKDTLPLDKNVEIINPSTDIKSNDGKENKQKTNSFKKPQDTVKSKTIKRKNITKAPDKAPSKTKKPKVENNKHKPTKNNTRKESYAKTVNNWLNDVDPNNPVEDDMLAENVGKQHEQITKRDKLEIEIEKGSEKKAVSKKVIQSQLANKGGIMKFKKPKDEKTEPNKADVAEPTKLDIEKDKSKEKKKSKFVVPIKSQIPVKDIVYEIRVLDEATVLKYNSDLWSIEEKNIVVTLLYSETLSKIFNSNTIISYDGKALLIYLMSVIKLDFDSTFNIIDTKIAGSLLEPDNPPENFSELQKVSSYTIQFTVATECNHQKSAWYMTLLCDVAETLRTLLHEKSLWNIFVDIEMRLLPIIADMEHNGIRVDMEALRSMESALLCRMRQVEQECHKAAGKSFQINSTQQVRAIIYDELQLDTRINVRIRETVAKGAKSTSELMLRNLVSLHPLPALILEYRRLHKAHATFLAGIAPHVKDGVIRPTWVQTAAATGRIACSNPNLQAIPKGSFSLSDIPGTPETTSNSDEKVSVVYLRDVYVSGADHVLVGADFRQVECRVFARAAADTALQRALAAPDLFRVLAAQWLQKPEEEVCESDRERTKRIVYASLYGAGTHKLMDILAVDYQRALAVSASFNRTFPSLRSFGRSTVERCLAAGGTLRTLCGRARSLPHIHSADLAQRAHAQRQAVNFIVQGTAADLCKLAMVNTVRRLRAEGLLARGEGGAGSEGVAGGARLLLQIHDELVWEVPEDQLHYTARVIQQEMEACGAAAGLGALPTQLSVGRAWGQLHPYAPPPPPDTAQSFPGEV